MPIVLNGEVIEVTYAGGDPRGDSLVNGWLISDLVVAGVTAVGNIYTFASRRIVVFTGAFLTLFDSVLVASGALTGAFVPIITRDGTGVIQMGYKDPLTGSVSRGCVVTWFNLTTNTQGVILDYCYDSFLQGRILATARLIGHFIITNAEFIKITAHRDYYGHITNGSQIQITDSSIGFRPIGVVTAMSDLNIEGCTYGAYISNIDGVEIRNAKIERCTTGYTQTVSGNLVAENTLINSLFTDCTIDITNFKTGVQTLDGKESIINIGEEFSITIRDEEDNVLPGALVTLQDKNGTIIFSVLTDINGHYEQDVIRYKDVVSRAIPDQTDIRVITDYNPFTLTVSFGTMQDYQSEIEITAKSDLQIKLIYSELQITAIAITDCSEIGADDGELVITAIGGDTTYEYSIDGITYQAVDTFTGLVPADYTVYVRDGEGTIVTFDVTISQPIPEAYAETVLYGDLTEEVLICDLTEEVLTCELTE